MSEEDPELEAERAARLERYRRKAADLVASLAPLDEAEAWRRAQDDPWTSLSPEQRYALEALEELDWLVTGQSRGCHYGACRLDDDGEVIPIDTSWRT